MTEAAATDTTTALQSNVQHQGEKPCRTGTGAKPAGNTDDKRHTILFVDDERPVLKALKRSFIDENYRILTAEDAQQAFDLLSRNRISLIISDFRMPGMNGTEFLASVRKRDPDIIRILLTGAADAKTVMAAIDEGILYKYITKPWDDDELIIAVRLAIAQYDLIRENKRLKGESGKREKEIDKLRRFINNSCSPLGSVLVDKGLILPAQLEMVEKYCSQNDIVLFRALVDLGMVEDKNLLKVIQEECNGDVRPLNMSNLNADLAELISMEVCVSGCLVPLARSGKTLVLAMADTLDLPRVDYIGFVTDLNITTQLASWSDIQRAIGVLYRAEDLGVEPESEELEPSEHADIDIILDIEEANTDEQLIVKSILPSPVRLVNAIISKAIRIGASDLHIEPKSDVTIVRFRVDGLLRMGMTIPPSLHLSTISRIKILSKMDISVRRIPQDGRITIATADQRYDLRVSTMPTIYGEKVVCRLLDKNVAVKSIRDIGIRGSALKRLENILPMPQGIIISTGPTGSGKTTTLYSLLNKRMSEMSNFVTIEDPVEYLLSDASQVFVHDKIGVTFASTLRCTLRQDPDVILVGEIRDLETAQAAFQAAMTGHLVFTSLHTNSSVAAVTRLIHLGIAPYLVASAVQGIIAQRLVRKICPNCRKLADYDKGLVNELGLDAAAFPEKLYCGTGCETCDNSGYQGRLGLFEVFHMTEESKYELTSHYDESQLTNMAVSMGMTTLLEDARDKVLDGSTTLEEVLRVLGPAVKYDYSCNKCGAELELQYNTCPYCGSEQRKKCGHCQAHLKSEWVACPYCGTTPKEKQSTQSEIT